MRKLGSLFLATLTLLLSPIQTSVAASNTTSSKSKELIYVDKGYTNTKIRDPRTNKYIDPKLIKFLTDYNLLEQELATTGKNYSDITKYESRYNAWNDIINKGYGVEITRETLKVETIAMWTRVNGDQKIISPEGSKCDKLDHQVRFFTQIFTCNSDNAGTLTYDKGVNIDTLGEIQNLKEELRTIELDGYNSSIKGVSPRLCEEKGRLINFFGMPVMCMEFPANRIPQETTNITIWNTKTKDRKSVV